MSKRLGILGGGQLGRMLALSAHPLGLSVVVVDPSAHCPARAVAEHIQCAFDDEDGLRGLTDCDFVTFEFENVPETAASQLACQGPVYPPVEALRVSQDRWVEKNTFQSLGISTTRCWQVDKLSDAHAAFQALGPMILKTRRFGYDGKGQAVVRHAREVDEKFALLEGAAAIAEQIVPFERELSLVVCRSQQGEIAFYPLVENIHRQGVLRTTLAPAPNISAELKYAAEKAATALVEHLNYVGVLALELFCVGDQLLANEFAPRVHNSGHWTIEGAFTSQFENHVRAVSGLPLGSTEVRSAAIMTNLIGQVPEARKILAIAGTHLHDYGKAPRSGRKVGHVTILGDTLADAQARTEVLESLL